MVGRIAVGGNCKSLFTKVMNIKYLCELSFFWYDCASVLDILLSVAFWETLDAVMFSIACFLTFVCMFTQGLYHVILFSILCSDFGACTGRYLSSKLCSHHQGHGKVV